MNGSVSYSYINIALSPVNSLPLILTALTGGGAETSGGTSRSGAAGSTVARVRMATGKSSTAARSPSVQAECNHCLHEAALDPHALEARAQD